MYDRDKDKLEMGFTKSEFAEVLLSRDLAGSSHVLSAQNNVLHSGKGESAFYTHKLLGITRVTDTCWFCLAKY